MKSIYEIFLELNEAHFGNQLPAADLSWNPRLSSTAGRFCPGRKSPFFRPPQIEIASYLKEIPDGEMHIRDTMLHEMIHLYLWAEGRPYGHTEEFLRIMKKVGAKRFNPVPKHRPFKHLYECPNCKLRTPTRKRISGSACLPCCKKYAGGFYDARFKLQRLDMPQETGELEPEKNIPVYAPGEEARPAPVAQAEEPRLPPSEIVRRLEELKQMLLRKTKTPAM